MSDYNLGTARGVIEIEYKGDGVDQARRDFRRSSDQASESSKGFDKAGQMMGASGLVIAGGLGLAVRAASSFEERMSAIQAVSGASGDELDALRNKALQLGKDTAFSASEAGSAIEELVKAGLPIKDVLNGAADATVALAAAGGVSLPEAASIASNAMNQFNLSARDMPKVADAIAGAANASAIDVSEFGMSLSQAGAVANLAGTNFKDAATAIALMGNAGIKGSDAGTSLKTFLMNLQPQTDKQIALFKKLGIVTKDGSNQFYDAKGNLKSLADVSGVLSRSLEGMSKKQKTATLETMFGSDAIRAAAVLADNGSKGFDKMAKSMDKVKAADVAKTRMKNLKGSLEQMKGSLETAGIAVGQILIPAFTKLANGITAVANKFLNLSPSIQKLITVLISAAGAFLLLGAGVVKFVKFVSDLKMAVAAIKGLTVVGKGLKLLKTGFTAVAGGIRVMSAAMLTSPVFWVVAAIVALVVALVLLYKKSATFRAIVQGAWNGIKTAVSAVVNWFKGTALPWLTSVWDGIKNGVSALKNFFVSVWNGIKNVTQSVFRFIGTVIRTNIQLWKNIIATVSNAILAVWRGVWKMFGPFLVAVWNFIKAAVRFGIQFVLAIVRTGMSILRSVWRAVRNGIKAVVAPVWNGIKNVVRGGINFVRNFISTHIRAIKVLWSVVWGAIRAVVSRIWNGIKNVVRSGVSSVRNAISNAWNALKNITSRLWGGLLRVVGDKIRSIVDKARSIKSRIVGIFAGAGKWLYNAGRNIIMGLIRGIESLFNTLSSKLNKLTNMIPKKKGPPEKDRKLLVQNGVLIMEGLMEGIDSVTKPLWSQLSSIGSSIPAAVGGGYPTTIMAGGSPTASSQASGGMELVRGRLSIDDSGVAWIEGVASRTVDRKNAHYRQVKRQHARKF